MDKTIKEMNADELFYEALSGLPMCSSINPPAGLDDMERWQYEIEVAKYPALGKSPERLSKEKRRRL